MVRGSLRQPIKGIFWGASANPIKFYYGRKDDPPINHDLCWKQCVGDEKEIMHEQQSRPRTTEHTISARKHDIYLSFDDEDREDASNMHAILRRMGYIVYSTVGQIRVRKATSGTADVRPLCVKFQKNEELAGEKQSEVARNAIKGCGIVIFVCRNQDPLSSSTLAHDLEVAESEGKQVLMLVMTAKKFLTMMTGAYGDELKKQLLRPQVFDFEKKIIDFSEVGDNQNESTADLAIRLFTKMLEKEMCFVPGGLFRGAFSGVGIPIIMKQKPMEEDQIRFFGDEMAAHTLKRVTESRQGLEGSRRRLSRDVSFESAPREDSIRSGTRASQREGGTAGVRQGAPSRSGARSGLAGGGTVSELIGRGGGGDAAGRQVFFKEGFIYVKEDRARAMGTGAGDANSSKEALRPVRPPRQQAAWNPMTTLNSSLGSFTRPTAVGSRPHTGNRLSFGGVVGSRGRGAMTPDVLRVGTPVPGA